MALHGSFVMFITITGGSGDLQTLICVLVARPRWCLTLSNPVPWQNWRAAYLGYTLQMKTLFRGWPVMVHDTHTRRRRRRRLQLLVTVIYLHPPRRSLCSLVGLFVMLSVCRITAKVICQFQWILGVTIGPTSRKNFWWWFNAAYRQTNRTGCSGVVVEYRTRNREVAGSTHTQSTASNFEQVANLLCAQANSASYHQRDGKWVVATATGWRRSVADWGDGVSASG